MRAAQQEGYQPAPVQASQPAPTVTDLATAPRGVAWQVYCRRHLTRRPRPVVHADGLRSIGCSPGDKRFHVDTVHLIHEAMGEVAVRGQRLRQLPAVEQQVAHRRHLFVPDIAQLLRPIEHSAAAAA